MSYESYCCLIATMHYDTVRCRFHFCHWPLHRRHPLYGHGFRSLYFVGSINLFVMFVSDRPLSVRRSEPTLAHRAMQRRPCKSRVRVTSTRAVFASLPRNFLLRVETSYRRRTVPIARRVTLEQDSTEHTIRSLLSVARKSCSCG